MNRVSQGLGISERLGLSARAAATHVVRGLVLRDLLLALSIGGVVLLCFAAQQWLAESMHPAAASLTVGIAALVIAGVTAFVLIQRAKARMARFSVPPWRGP